MSLKNVIRARFRNSDKSEKVGSGEDKEEEATSCSTPTNVSCRKITRPGKMNIPEEDTFESGSAERETENSSISGQGSVQGSPESPRSECIHPLSPEDRISFEQHLTQLQEQLVAIMMENQALTTELNEYKSVCQLEKVKQELDYEKSRNLLLEEKCQTLEKRRRKVQRSKSDATHHTCPEETDCHDIKERSLKEDDREALNDFIEVKVVGPKTRWQRVWDSIVCQIYEIINDFSEVPESVPEVDTDGDPLTVRKLKNNITRFGAVTQPYMNTIQGLKNLVQWKSPSYTLFVFTVYMYSTWNGLLLPVTLFLILFRLAINYMRYKGWNLNLHYLDPGEEVKESEDKDKGVSDKFNVVLQVAKKVQNTLGALADTLEKINSLLTWRYPPATKQLFSAICLAFIVSCLFEASMIFYVIGILIGIKLFIIDYMFEHFPRFKQKYDSSHRLWENLPTEAEFRKKTMRVQIDKHILPLNQFEDKEEIDQTMDFMTDNDKSFCELFNLPHSENPLQGWHGGRRCALINKDKSLTAAFKNGKLYLTRSFLCFERTKFPSSKNLVLPLSDIIKLERAKPYPWLPGGGMAIEVTMADSEKPYIFGALLNREECYQSIQSAGSAGGWNWGEQSSSASSTSSSSSNLASTSSQSKSSPHKRLHRSHTLRFDETVTYAYTDTDVDDC